METQVLVALVGVGGTLAGVALGQVFSWISDAKSQDSQRSARWDSGQKELAAEILAVAVKLEREACSAAAHLDREVREQRLPGNTSLLLIPAEGIPGVLDELTVLILREAVEEGFAGIEALEASVEKFAIVASPDAGVEARQLVESIWDAYGSLESFETFDDAVDNVERVRAARDRFSNAVRESLGVKGEVVSDQRPRLED